MAEQEYLDLIEDNKKVKFDINNYEIVDKECFLNTADKDCIKKRDLIIELSKKNPFIGLHIDSNNNTNYYKGYFNSIHRKLKNDNDHIIDDNAEDYVDENEKKKNNKIFFYLTKSNIFQYSYNDYDHETKLNDIVTYKKIIQPITKILIEKSLIANSDDVAATSKDTTTPTTETTTTNTAADTADTASPASITKTTAVTDPETEAINKTVNAAIDKVLDETDISENADTIGTTTTDTPAPVSDTTNLTPEQQEKAFEITNAKMKAITEDPNPIVFQNITGNAKTGETITLTAEDKKKYVIIPTKYMQCITSPTTLDKFFNTKCSKPNSDYKNIYEKYLRKIIANKDKLKSDIKPFYGIKFPLIEKIGKSANYYGAIGFNMSKNEINISSRDVDILFVEKSFLQDTNYADAPPAVTPRITTPGTGPGLGPGATATTTSNTTPNIINVEIITDEAAAAEASAAASAAKSAAITAAAAAAAAAKANLPPKIETYLNLIDDKPANFNINGFVNLPIKCVLNPILDQDCMNLQPYLTKLQNEIIKKKGLWSYFGEGIPEPKGRKDNNGNPIKYYSGYFNTNDVKEFVKTLKKKKIVDNVGENPIFLTDATISPKIRIGITSLLFLRDAKLDLEVEKIIAVNAAKRQEKPPPPNSIMYTKLVLDDPKNLEEEKQDFFIPTEYIKIPTELLVNSFYYPQAQFDTIYDKLFTDLTNKLPQGMDKATLKTYIDYIKKQTTDETDKDYIKYIGESRYTPNFFLRGRILPNSSRVSYTPSNPDFHLYDEKGTLDTSFSISFLYVKKRAEETEKKMAAMLKPKTAEEKAEMERRATETQESIIDIEAKTMNLLITLYDATENAVLTDRPISETHMNIIKTCAEALKNKSSGVTEVAKSEVKKEGEGEVKKEGEGESAAAAASDVPTTTTTAATTATTAPAAATTAG